MCIARIAIKEWSISHFFPGDLGAMGGVLPPRCGLLDGAVVGGVSPPRCGLLDGAVVGGVSPPRCGLLDGAVVGGPGNQVIENQITCYFLNAYLDCRTQHLHNLVTQPCLKAKDSRILPASDTLHAHAARVVTRVATCDPRDDVRRETIELVTV